MLKWRPLQTSLEKAMAPKSLSKNQNFCLESMCQWSPHNGSHKLQRDISK